MTRAPETSSCTTEFTLSSFDCMTPNIGTAFFSITMTATARMGSAPMSSAVMTSSSGMGFSKLSSRTNRWDTTRSNLSTLMAWFDFPPMIRRFTE